MSSRLRERLNGSTARKAIARDGERIRRARGEMAQPLAAARLVKDAYCGAGAAGGTLHFQEVLPFTVTWVGTLGALHLSEAGGVAVVSVVVAAGAGVDPAAAGASAAKAVAEPRRATAKAAPTNARVIGDFLMRHGSNSSADTGLEGEPVTRLTAR